MTVSVATPHTAVRDGETFYFCCAGCRRKFLGDGPPAASPPAAGCCGGTTSAQVDRAAVVDPRAVYTCPMHPEVEQVGPGACPECGMDLEPKDIAAGAGDDGELSGMVRRFIWAAVLTVPLFLLAMLPMVGLPVDRWLGGTAHAWLQLVLATPVVFWAGWPCFDRGIRGLVAGRPSMFSLVALGTGAAWPARPAVLGLLVLSGLAATAGQLLMTAAYRRGRAAPIAAAAATGPLLSALLGAALLGQTPGPRAAAGMAASDSFERTVAESSTALKRDPGFSSLPPSVFVLIFLIFLSCAVSKSSRFFLSSTAPISSVCNSARTPAMGVFNSCEVNCSSRVSRTCASMRCRTT
jgi:uncharacterized membrane protein